MSDLTNSRSRFGAALPIVGVGASAGGLEAFAQLLSGLPQDTGLGFVLIQHLDPTHPSLLRDVLARATAMPVHQAEDGMSVEPNHVYVIAPNTCLSICEGKLDASPRDSEPTQHLPVDHFLRSLAADLGSHAIGVILSGTGSDGTDGLRAIRAEAGITFAQDPHSAKFPGMPQSAVDAGVVDHCMDVPNLAAGLVRLSRHPYEQPREPAEQHTDENVRVEILARVRSAIGVDFSEFKLPTVTRRLARRLALRGVMDLRAYLALLDTEPDEIRALYEDLLIHVTSFFRDPQVFESLRARVFPEILKHKPEGGSVRAWVAGCSTGEEVYSLAIEWLDFSRDSNTSYPIQLFGSDLSELAIRKARAGVFSENAMHGVSDERRKHYFTKTDAGYQICKRVRDLCVFVRHDLTSDAPFSKLDLASCRNVLIYFDQALQKQIVPMLHYCLNQTGFLLLGRSESISAFSQLFSVVDKTNKIFVRTAAANSARFGARGGTVEPAGSFPRSGQPSQQPHTSAVAKHLDRLLLARYCPPGVLVNEHLDVLLFRGQTGAYLQAAPGQPQNNLIGMARGGLIAPLRATIAQAKQDAVGVRSPTIEVDQEGSTKRCEVVVLPLSGLPDSQEQLFAVLFEEPGPNEDEAVLKQPTAGALDGSSELRRSARLEYELAATKSYFQTRLEEHGRSSDELGSSNEELVSANEELQSLNEELETAKEELQSSNEELTTLNDDLQARGQEVNQLNSDLLNFAVAVDIAMLTLDMARRIRRFTPKASDVLNVLASDVGRCIDEIKLNVDVPDLKAQISEVLTTETVKETEVQDKHGRWFRMRLGPYLTSTQTVDGITVSLIDIHELKQLVADAHSARAVAQAARSEAERANNAKDDFLATLSHELRTPLSSLLLNAQRLRSGDVVERAELQRAGEALEHATSLQVKLIDDLLYASHIVTGKLALECGPVDLGEIVQAEQASLMQLALGKNLDFRVAVAPALSRIWADRAGVQKVVSHLLTNAIKYTPHGGRVAVVVEASAGFARLCVTDSGIGIEAEFLPHVFARFSQSDTSITRKYGGLGLGLALVRHLVELHGGEVHAQSAGTGQGAMFSVTFPLVRGSDTADAKLAAAPRSIQALDRPGNTQRYEGLVQLRVLFVDDDPGTREAVREVLELCGAQVALAASAAEGVAAIATFKPQVILCDIAMPGEDGYTFMRKLRAREATQGTSIPALAFTALTSDDAKRRTLSAGFQLHLAKPIDIDRLREAVLALSKWAPASQSTP